MSISEPHEHAHPRQEHPGGRTRREPRFRRLLGLVMVTAMVTALSITGASVGAAAPTAAAPSATPPQSTGQPDFGPNVKIFDPSMPTSQIQAAVDAVRDQQVDNEMGTQRWALLFKP
ncbi:MAG TPA: adenylyl cyclase, partial [Dermatophilaceae bacterium]